MPVMERLSPWILLPLLCFIIRHPIHRSMAQQVQCKESDRQALNDLKSGLEDSENRLSTWQGSNCCQWWGITCENRTGAVIAVDLHNPYPFGYDSSGRSGSWNLSGEIRPSLTKLKSLGYLDLNYNTLNGTIPAFISSMGKLQYLNLSNAGFTGDFPLTFGNLSSLQVLDVSTNYVGLTIHNFDWTFGLDSLENLLMNGANLSMASKWDEALNNLPALTELHLSACGLSSFTSSLTPVNFTSLAVLDLSGNNFNSKLPNWLVNISSLVSVDISSSELKGRIPLGFSELPNLKSLKLGDNYNLTASCSELFQGSWEKIEVLSLFLNELHGRIPYSVGNMSSLIELDLFHNNVNGGIPSSIGTLCNLQSIDLSSNNLTGTLPEFLEGTCSAKSHLPGLHTFVSDYNQLVGHLPDWLGLLENLVVLNLQYNFLKGPIPPSLGNLQQLSQLRLEANMLNGTLPTSLGQLSSLTVLDVSINQLTGTITDDHFSSLKKLQILLLSANSFVLNFSPHWVPPFQAMYLDVGSCNLGPSFPSWIKSQKLLNFLDMSNASISGSLPNWFWDISSNLTLLNVSLNHLEGHLRNPFSIAPNADVDLSSNFFEGPIPLPKVGIELLDLSNNKFSGPIPNEMGKVSLNLVFLSLSNNQLNGEVPSSLGEMLSLQVIDLASNNLSGTVPASIGNCSLLRVLDLQNNTLSGLVPESISQLNLLETLHLSRNKLSGEIPPSLKNLSHLETLDLAYNGLKGIIPTWIGDSFQHLRILSLRSNFLSGELPFSLSNLSSLQVLDLANNELNGPIPASFGSFEAMSQKKNLSHYLFYGKFRTAYYEENLFVNIYGQLQKYTKTLSLLTSIDLSENNLQGDFPQEITNLLGLMVLNLSRNNISGQLPGDISNIQQLLTLDVSGNQLSGSIPASIPSMSFLQDLNLSNNNFMGQIPYKDHLTTFDASSFSGNPELCGEPLSIQCPSNQSNDQGTKDIANDNGNGLIDKCFWLSIGVGYSVGLLLPFFVFAIRRPWSYAYFILVDRIVDRILWFSSTKNRAAISERIQPAREASVLPSSS